MRYLHGWAQVFILLQLILISCSSDQDKKPTVGSSYKVINPRIVDTVFTKEYIADIHSLQNVEIRTRVKGFIEKIHVDEGKPVQAGEVLFTLGGREFKENLLKANANYKSAVAELRVAEVELKNTRTLAEKNIVSDTELEMAKARKEAIEAKIEEAQSAISIAQLNLSYTQVKAPFTGVINRIPYKAGSLVSEGDLLTTISNNMEVFAYFHVSEKEFLDFMKKNSDRQLNEVSLLMANNEMFPYTGKVETAENEIDKGTGNIAFRARFNNPKKMLKHGATGKILVKEKVDNAMIIPQKSTFEIQDKVYVYVLDSTNKVRMRNVIPRLRLSNLYILQSGLSTKDRVIFEGIQQVKEGEAIQAQLIDLGSVNLN